MYSKPALSAATATRSNISNDAGISRLASVVVGVAAPSEGTSRTRACAHLAACLDCLPADGSAQLALAAAAHEQARSARPSGESICCSTASVRQSLAARHGGRRPSAGGAGRRTPAGTGGNAFERRPRPRRPSTSSSPTCRASPGWASRPATSRREKRVRDARFRPAGARASCRGAFHAARGIARGALRGRRAGQSRRLGRAGARLWPQAAGRSCSAAGDRAGARRLPAGRVQRRRDQRAITAAARPSRALRRMVAAPIWHGGGPAGARRHPEAAGSRAAHSRRSPPKGPGYLYGGALGRAIVAHLAKLGGMPDLADLPRSAGWNEPITASYRGLAVNSRRRPARDSSSC